MHTGSASKAAKEETDALKKQLAQVEGELASTQVRSLCM
jgi:hypothetical protein